MYKNWSKISKYFLNAFLSKLSSISCEISLSKNWSFYYRISLSHLKFFNFNFIQAFCWPAYVIGKLTCVFIFLRHRGYLFFLSTLMRDSIWTKQWWAVFADHDFSRLKSFPMLFQNIFIFVDIMKYVYIYISRI